MTNKTKISLKSNTTASANNKLSEYSFAIKQIFITFLQIINYSIIAFSCFLLIVQTVYIISKKDPKYINLRHITIKWLICLAVYQAMNSIENNETVSTLVLKICLSLVILFVAYPTQVLKAIHLKYFSQDSDIGNALNDPNSYDISFFNKILVSLVVFFLNAAKFIIVFIPPAHRKPIKEALQQTNLVIVKNKNFWTIIDDKEKGDEEKDLFVRGGNFQFNLEQKELSVRSERMKMEEDVVVANGWKCSLVDVGSFKPVKKVLIKYTFSTSDLEVKDVQLGRKDTYILEDIELLEKENVIKFGVLGEGQIDQDDLFIKFNNRKQTINFFTKIQQIQAQVE